MGFGLSNDERRGATEEFAPAFAIAARAGLASVPHGGELLGPASIRTTIEALHPDRLGHGVRSAEDPQLLERIVRSGIGLELCPASNVALGVYETLAEVPLRTLVDAGAQIALGADDPLLFGPRLVAQYQAARDLQGFSDAELAALARASVELSRAPLDVRKRLLAAIDDGSPASRPRPSCPVASSAGNSRTGRASRGVLATEGTRSSRRLSRSRHPSSAGVIGRDQREQPTSTGSGSRTTPNAARTPSRISRARPTRSAAPALRRDWSRRACAWSREPPARADRGRGRIRPAR